MNDNQNLIKHNDGRGILEKLWENRPLDISLKFIATLSGVISIIPVLSNFFSSGVISLGAASIVGGLIFLATTFIYYFIFLRPRLRQLISDNELLKTENNEINQNANRLSRQLVASEEAYQTVDREAGRYLSKLKKYDWVISMADEQQLKISDYIFLERGFYCFAKLEEDIPYINFGFDILNKSFYDIQFDPSIKGYIECENKHLFGDKILVQSGAVIPAMNDGTLTITQRITESELPFLRKLNPFKANQFRLEHIVINFKIQGFEKLQKLEIRQPFAQEKD